MIYELLIEGHFLVRVLLLHEKYTKYTDIRSYRYAEPFRLFATARIAESRAAASAGFATADAHLQYVITEYFIPELAKITGRDLGFHFDDSTCN